MCFSLRRAVGVASGSITLVQTDDISVIKVLTAAHAGCVMSLAWNGSVLASSGLDGKIRTWDVATVETATALKTHTMSDTDSKILLNIESRQQHLAFSPDGKRLAVAGLPAVHVLDAATLQPMQELSRGAAPSSTLAWSPNSLYLAVGGCAEEEGALCKVLVWNTAKGTVVQDFDSASNISCLAFADNKVRLSRHRVRYRIHSHRLSPPCFHRMSSPRATRTAGCAAWKRWTLPCTRHPLQT